MYSGSLAMQTDFYQITMAAAYHANGMSGQACFSLFARHMPAERSFMVAAGLEEVLDFLESFAFAPEDIDYLASLGRFTPDFLKELARVRFSGDVWALPEGSICFPDEPFLEVTAPIMEAQLVETYLINVINLQSTLASKAARCLLAAQGRNLVDFSLRRTQGIDAGLAAARSSAMVGFQGTSNLAAARKYGIAPVGTMAHSFVEAFGDELSAFRAFAKTFPEHTVILVDTYDSVAGLHRAAKVAGEMLAQGQHMVGVRLDSGDLVGLSRQARTILDQAGLEQARVVVSGSLDETRIEQMLEQGAKVDLFAVGTKMGSSADAPFLDLAYKLVSYDGRPTLKLSAGKETWVGAKQVWRHLASDGRMGHDLLALREEEQPGRPLLRQVMSQGRRLGPSQDWRAAHERFKEDLAQMPAATLRLKRHRSPRLDISPTLRGLQDKVRAATLKRQGGDSV